MQQGNSRPIRLAPSLTGTPSTHDAQSKPSRFILLGRSRTGSNLLRSYLNSHDRLRVFGELFGDAESIRWELPGYPQHPWQLWLLRNCPLLFLKRYVFGQYARGVDAVGFKLFYYHARRGAWQRVWNYLVEDREIKIIHLKRRNILRTLVSRKLASALDRWIDKSLDDASIDLAYDECVRTFEETRRWEREYDRLFEEHPRHNVWYVDMCSDPETQLDQIQDFLGVQRRRLATSMRKQLTQPLRRSIRNYSELKEGFRDTEWGHFFEE